MTQRTEQMTGFFEQIQSDKRLRPVHLSLCMALCSCWKSNNYQMPFRITRKRIMALASICSTATYHQCMRDLSTFGHIKYRPDYNYYKGSQVAILNRLHHAGLSGNSDEPGISGLERGAVEENCHPKIKRVGSEPRHKIRQVLRSFMPVERSPKDS